MNLKKFYHKIFQMENLKTVHRFSVTLRVCATHYLKYGNCHLYILYINLPLCVFLVGDCARMKRNTSLWQV